MKGRELCYHHGGKNPRGIAANNYKHGRRSKDIPARLADRYQAAITDPDLLQLNDNIAIIDARIGELLAAMDGPGGSALWATVQDHVNDIWAAIRGNDPKRVGQILRDTQTILDQGRGEADQWEEIFDLMERQRRQTETQRKTLVDMQQMITVERLMLFLGAFLGEVRNAITANVSDADEARRTLSAIQASAARYMGGDMGGG